MPSLRGGNVLIVGDMGISRGNVRVKGKAKGTKGRAKGPRDSRRGLKGWGSPEAKMAAKGKEVRAKAWDIRELGTRALVDTGIRECVGGAGR